MFLSEQTSVFLLEEKSIREKPPFAGEWLGVSTSHLIPLRENYLGQRLNHLSQPQEENLSIKTIS